MCGHRWDEITPAADRQIEIRIDGDRFSKVLVTNNSGRPVTISPPTAYLLKDGVIHWATIGLDSAPVATEPGAIDAAGAASAVVTLAAGRSREYPVGFDARGSGPSEVDGCAPNDPPAGVYDGGVLLPAVFDDVMLVASAPVSVSYRNGVGLLLPG